MGVEAEKSQQQSPHEGFHPATDVYLQGTPDMMTTFTHPQRRSTTSTQTGFLTSQNHPDTTPMCSSEDPMTCPLASSTSSTKYTVVTEPCVMVIGSLFQGEANSMGKQIPSKAPQGQLESLESKGIKDNKIKSQYKFFNFKFTQCWLIIIATVINILYNTEIMKCCTKVYLLSQQIVSVARQPSVHPSESNHSNHCTPSPS